MSEPFEIIAAPYTVYLAPVGTAVPDIDDVPGGDWTKLGVSGPKNYEESGVIVEHDQTLVPWRSAGGTGARDVFRSQENVVIRVQLADLSPEMYAKTLNDVSITVVAAGPGVAGTKTFPLQRGLTVARFGLLARGASPVNDALNAQYAVPMVYNAGQPKVSYTKAVPAQLECIFMTLEHATDGFGVYSAQTAAAT